MQSKSHFTPQISPYFSALILTLVGFFVVVPDRAQQPSASPETQRPSATALTDSGTQQRPLPGLARVGVDSNHHRPLSLRDAIAMALQNNKDIEIARDHVKMAEFDLLGARGFYDPRFSTTAFYERVENPI